MHFVDHYAYQQRLNQENKWNYQMNRVTHADVQLATLNEKQFAGGWKQPKGITKKEWGYPFRSNITEKKHCDVVGTPLFKTTSDLNPDRNVRLHKRSNSYST